MALRWHDELATGVVELDDQHRQLFAQINQLLDACRTGQAAAQVRQVVQFLEVYVVEHFRAEEREMRTLGYPLYGMHKAQHDGFLEAFAKLKAEAASRQGLSITLATNRLLTDWWINHISGSDRELGRFIVGRVGTGHRA